MTAYRPYIIQMKPYTMWPVSSLWAADRYVADQRGGGFWHTGVIGGGELDFNVSLAIAFEILYNIVKLNFYNFLILLRNLFLSFLKHCK
jgi:hypothetical protein